MCVCVYTCVNVCTDFNGFVLIVLSILHVTVSPPALSKVALFEFTHEVSSFSPRTKRMVEIIKKGYVCIRVSMCAQTLMDLY